MKNVQKMFACPPTWFNFGSPAGMGPEKELELVGRVDRQLNLNGIRLEPEQVEAVLKQKVPGAFFCPSIMWRAD